MTNNSNEQQKAGRPTLRERPDKRITVRFRHYCDQDLIQVLKQVPNASKFIRESMRARLKQEDASNA